MYRMERYWPVSRSRRNRPQWCESSSSLKASDGVLQPRVFRGRRLSVGRDSSDRSVMIAHGCTLPDGTRAEMRAIRDAARQKNEETPVTPCLQGHASSARLRYPVKCDI